PAHHRDRPAAAPRTLPAGALETADGSLRRTFPDEFIFDRLERGANSVAQLREPGLGLGAAAGFGREGVGRFVHGSGNSRVWRSASASAMAPATATLSDRAGRRKGMTTRAAAHA